MKNKSINWIFSISGLSLLASASVYCFARTNPPELLALFQATHPELTTQTELFGSAPSFFYTLAIGLFVGLCASTQKSRQLHCLLWMCLVLILELTQHPIIAGQLVTWLPDTLPVSIWEIIGPYWFRGVFDQHDLLASLVGGGIALITFT